MPAAGVELSPMAPGGAWIALDGKPPVYATHEAHVKRLLSEEGGRIIADPRTPQSEAPAAVSQSDLLEEIARLKAQLAAAQGIEEVDAGQIHNEPAHSTREAHDRRSKR